MEPFGFEFTTLQLQSDFFDSSNTSYIISNTKKKNILKVKIFQKSFSGYTHKVIIYLGETFGFLTMVVALRVLYREKQSFV